MRTIPNLDKMNKGSKAKASVKVGKAAAIPPAKKAAIKRNEAAGKALFSMRSTGRR